MLIGIFPEPIHEKEQGGLTLQLSEEAAGDYQFRFQPELEIFKPRNQLEKRFTPSMTQSDRVDVDVVFPAPDDYTLQGRLGSAGPFRDLDVITVLPAATTIASLEPEPIHVNEFGVINLALGAGETKGKYTFSFEPGDNIFDGDKSAITLEMEPGEDKSPEVVFPRAMNYRLYSKFGSQNRMLLGTFPVRSAVSPEPDLSVALAAPPRPISEDEVLWRFIDLITDRLRFDEFREFVMDATTPPDRDNWQGTIAYDVLREVAEEFVNVAADPKKYTTATELGPEFPAGTVNKALRRSYVHDEGKDLASPFLLPFEQGEFKFPLPNVPFVELIWNYWTEEGMLVQTMHHILAKFQNRRPGPGADPLERFDLNPLLPLRQLLWGFAEDERRRLTVRRRAAEYEYEYGLQLRGRAIPPQSTVVERRSAFVEAFHRLLHTTHQFFKERDDKTIDADAFPLLSALREVHLVLAYGAHNQFANLAIQARAEMLTMQWLLAQPEMREFLGGRTMVPYEEPWMDRVDTMKSIQGWSDTSITHFFDLAFHGERILLSVRHGRWNESTRDRDDAANWALRARNSIQRYIHAYRAVTGVDLAYPVNGSAPPDFGKMPSDLLARRLGAQRRRA